MKTFYQRIKRRFPEAMDACLRVLSNLERRTWLRGLLFVLVLALTGGIMYLLNLHTPMLMDDYDYLYSWETGKPLAGFGDVFRSQMVHFQIGNGRFITHLIAQGTLYLGKNVFNVANTAMFLIFLLEIYFLSKPKGVRFEWMLLLAQSLILMTMVPFFGMVFLWQTGACNYLWGTVLALLPVVMLRAVREYGRFAQSRWSAVLFPVVGFVAGFTNENTACGVIALVFVALILDWLEGRRTYRRLWVMWFAQCVGTVTMLLAPGNAVRAQSFESESMIVELIRRFVNITAYGMSYLGVLFALTLLLCLLLKGKGARIGYAMLLMFGALIAGYAMLGSPVLSDRTFTGVFALVLCAVMVLFSDLMERTEHIGAAKLAALPVLLVFLSYTGYHGVKDVCEFEAEQNALISTIEEAASSGAEEVLVSPVDSTSRFTMSMLIGEEATMWPNTTLEKHFGVRVRAKDAAP